MQTILATGLSGFVGSVLLPRWLHDPEVEVIALTREPQRRARAYPQLRWIASLDEIGDTEPVDAILNLAGPGMPDRRWTATRKQDMVSARVTVTQDVVRLCARLA